MEKIIWAVVLLSIFILSATTNVQGLSLVDDRANLLTVEQREELNEHLEQMEATQTQRGENAQMQFAVITLQQLPSNQSIEEWSLQEFNRLGIGHQGTNRGILLVLSVDDRVYRIQLGDGFNNTAINEDAITSQVFTETINDTLRTEDFVGGINQMTANMFQLIGEHYELSNSARAFADMGEGWTNAGTSDNRHRSIFFVIISMLVIGPLGIGGLLLYSVYKKGRNRKKIAKEIEVPFQTKYARNWLNQTYNVDNEAIKEWIVETIPYETFDVLQIREYLVAYGKANCVAEEFSKEEENNVLSWEFQAQQRVIDHGIEEFCKRHLNGWTKEEINQYIKKTAQKWHENAQQNQQIVQRALERLPKDYPQDFKEYLETTLFCEVVAPSSKLYAESAVQRILNDGLDQSYMSYRLNRQVQLGNLDSGKYDVGALSVDLAQNQEFLSANTDDIFWMILVASHFLNSERYYTKSYQAQQQQSNIDFGNSFGGGVSSGGGASGSW